MSAGIEKLIQSIRQKRGRDGTETMRRRREGSGAALPPASRGLSARPPAGEAGPVSAGAPRHAEWALAGRPATGPGHAACGVSGQPSAQADAAGRLRGDWIWKRLRGERSAPFGRREATVEAPFAHSTAGFVYPDASLGLRLGSAHQATIRGPTASRGRVALCDLPALGLGTGTRGQGSKSERPEVTSVTRSLDTSRRLRPRYPGRPGAGGAALRPRPPPTPHQPRGPRVLTARCAPHAAVARSGPNPAPPSRAATPVSSRAPPCGDMPPSAPPRAPCLTLLLVVPSESPRGPLVPPLVPSGPTCSQSPRGRCRPTLPSWVPSWAHRPAWGGRGTAQLQPSEPRWRDTAVTRGLSQPRGVAGASSPAADSPEPPEALATPLVRPSGPEIMSGPSP